MHVSRLGSAALTWVALVVLSPATAAAADSVILRNGDLVTGDVQVSQLTLSTPAGSITVARQDVTRVVLGVAGGDVVVLHTPPSGLTGLVEQPAYQVRLAAGPTVSIARRDIAVLILRPR